ncbi:ROK family protein [Streptomyces sp. NPDC006458]|uniref:ROK family protein n=1 Tax=Streptomyces sp. NPDC006458 TaxID=3154302 RepID=UPI0033B70A85
MRDPAPRECVIALDVGGTSMKGALFDSGLGFLSTLRRPTPRRSGPDAVVSAIAAALCAIKGHATARGLRIRATTVVVPGIVDEEAERAVYSANIGWRDLPLAALLRAATGLSLTVGHDIRAGGLAECGLGAARGARDVLFVPIGTSISGAVVCDGQAVRAGGYAGELGHMVVEPDGMPCPCGRRGCLETVASAASIERAYARRCGRPVKGALEVAALVAQGDREARLIWRRAVGALARALTAYSTLLAPEVIVVGGGLAEAGGLLLDPLRARLAEELTFQRRPTVLRAELGDQAACFGAGLRAWQEASRTAAGSAPDAAP